MFRVCLQIIQTLFIHRFNLCARKAHEETLSGDGFAPKFAFSDDICRRKCFYKNNLVVHNTPNFLTGRMYKTTTVSESSAYEYLNVDEAANTEHVKGLFGTNLALESYECLS
jgi:hypothetical protein